MEAANRYHIFYNLQIFSRLNLSTCLLAISRYSSRTKKCKETRKYQYKNAMNLVKSIPNPPVVNTIRYMITFAKKHSEEIRNWTFHVPSTLRTAPHIWKQNHVTTRVPLIGRCDLVTSPVWKQNHARTREFITCVEHTNTYLVYCEVTT